MGTQYAFINATPVTMKRDRILLDDITELIHSSLKLSDFQQDLNPDYPSKRFVYGYAHDKEIYSLEVEGQKPDGVIGTMYMTESCIYGITMTYSNKEVTA